MGLLDDLRSTFARGFAPIDEPPSVSVRTSAIVERGFERTQFRSIEGGDPSLGELVAATGSGRLGPWRTPTIREALGVPSIFRAVSLIAQTTGSLPVEAYRNGALLTSQATPAIVTRPDPFRTPREFYRDCAYYLATRGEAPLWVAKRDLDGTALSLIVVPPWELTLDVGTDRLRPTIRWGGRIIPNEDLRLITFLPADDGSQRGVGPMQLCGAALSVAVESQEWAANFFAEDGGYPSIGIKASGTLAEDPDTGVHEADTLRAQWMSKPHNTPRVYDDAIEEIREFSVNAQGAQMLEARTYETGDAARMFGIPGSLLEYSAPGSSLTYQNVEGEYTKFVRTCLAPNYLEPIEQEVSDLLTRSTVARFNVKGLLRADVKTRFEVYALGIANGIITAEQAAQAEGLVPGDVEYAPVPPAAPAAVPDALPPDGVGRFGEGPIVPYLEQRSPENGAPVRFSAPILQRTAEVDDGSIRCEGTRVLRGILQPCGKRLASDWVGKCPRCKREYPVAA